MQAIENTIGTAASDFGSDVVSSAEGLLSDAGSIGSAAL
eukprot:CAMPEP_0113896546 /NCGR_PEP_ID=MMETSP0780_2-20120614/18103_1 /TAXON_ID=652834 /ORGANISM="Palpitomonas bilix" /LENGTH=38 /DNA_ID=CAMNT_0000887749 /DNA_START=91 /DNA_END=204 /DNA_ORIENTATION=+ /assembly_acc=CAM_ASM_000599